MTQPDFEMMVKVLVNRAGGAIDINQSDLADVRPGSRIVLTALPGGKDWILSLDDGTISDTVTIVEVKALPAR